MKWLLILVGALIMVLSVSSAFGELRTFDPTNSDFISETLLIRDNTEYKKASYNQLDIISKSEISCYHIYEAGFKDLGKECKVEVEVNIKQLIFLNNYGIKGDGTYKKTEIINNTHLNIYFTPTKDRGSFDIELWSGFDKYILDPDYTQSACGTLASSGTYEMDQDINTTGNCITIGADNIVFDCAGFNITGGGGSWGIENDGHDNVTVKNCEIYDFTIGYYGHTTHNNFTLYNNTIKECTFTGQTNYDIYVTSDDYVIEDNDFKFSSVGVYSIGNDTLISGNTFVNQTTDTIYLEGDNHRVLNNNITNYLTGNINHIHIESAYNNTIDGNRLIGNTYYRMYERDTSGVGEGFNTWSNNYIGEGAAYGVFVMNTLNSTFLNNTFQGGGSGFRTWSVNKNTNFINNTFNSTSRPFHLDNYVVKNALFKGNWITDAYVAFEIENGCNNCLIEDNYVEASTRFDVSNENSINTTFRNNVFNSSDYTYGQYLKSCNNVTYDNNTFNGDVAGFDFNVYLNNNNINLMFKNNNFLKGHRHIVDTNTGNYNISVINNTFHTATDYDLIINSYNWDIIGNTFYDSPTVNIYFAATANNNTISRNNFTSTTNALYISNLGGDNVFNNSVHGNIWADAIIWTDTELYGTVAWGGGYVASGGTKYPYNSTNGKITGDVIDYKPYTVNTIPDLTSPIVTLNTPADNEVITSPTVTLNCSVSDTVDIFNVTLWGDFTGSFSINSTNASGVNNIDYLFDITFSSYGDYVWNCEACDRSGNCAFAAANRTVSYPAPVFSFSVYNYSTEFAVFNWSTVGSGASCCNDCNSSSATDYSNGGTIDGNLIINGTLNVTGIITNSLHHMMGAVTDVHNVTNVDTWYNLTFNDTLGNTEGLTFLENKTLVIAHDGHYTITFGAGVLCTDNSDTIIGLRVAKNGIELPLSYIQIGINDNQETEKWIEHTTHATLSKDDQLNMQYIGDDTCVRVQQIDTYATQGFHAYGYIQEILI